MARYIVVMIMAAMTIEAEAAKVMYARLTDNNQTLTFYYDENYQDGSDMQVKAFANSEQRGWNSLAAGITKAVIDASFADARPTSTAFWFYECTSLATIDGLRNVNTSQVTDMSFMFSGTALTTVSIGRFQTDKVTKMSCMFQGCGQLQRVDMAYLKPGPVLQDISKMFASCISLTTIICNNDFSGVATGDDVFYRCFNLRGGGNTAYNGSMISKTYAKPDETSRPGYFTTSILVDIDDCNITLTTSSYQYDGSPKTPGVSVRRKSDGTTVSADSYSVSYVDNVKASGSPKVIVSGADGSMATLPFSIAKVRLTVSVTDAEKTYGEDMTPTPAISYAGFVNGEGVAELNTQGQVFFEEEITQWTKAGTYKIYARYVRADNYEAEYVDGTLTIHPKDIAGATVTIADYDHTGNAITPEAVVTLEGYGTLQYYRDYEVTATDNVDPGTATATITGKGNYTGSVQQPFTINDINPLVDVTNCTVVILDHAPYVYDGSAKTPEVQVKRSDDTVVETDGYTVTYEDNIKASGSPKVIVWGRDDTHASANFTIEKATLTVSVTDAEKTYGENTTLTPSISYSGFVNGENTSALNTQGQVFFEEEIGQWTKAGTYKIYARYVRADNYEANYIDGTLTIHPKNIAEATVTIDDYEETGHPITPEAKVELEGYGTLQYYRDYDITAENNLEPGTATAIITGKGNYTGTVQKEFTINESSPLVDVSNCEIVVEEHEPYVYDGQPKTPAIQVRRKSDNGILATECYRVVYEDNTNASGSPRIVVWGRNDTHISTNFSIAKVSLKVSVTDAEKTYGEDVTLEPVISYEGFVNGEDVSALRTQGQVFFEEEIGQWSKAGTYKIYARYVRADNYEADYTDGTLTIHPKNIGESTVTIRDYKYSGHAITPEATVELADYGTLQYYRDYDITAENNLEPGTATAIITGKGNYTGTIQKAFGIYMNLTGVETIENTSDADDRWTDLQGRRISQPTRKGIYIRNGQKIYWK